MAPREFHFRGKSVEELKALSTEEFILLLPSSERRKAKRGFTLPEKNLLAKLAKRDRVKTHAREMIVLPSMLEKTILVHNGKEFSQVVVQPEMLGKRLGTFALTRKITKHSSAGVTASKKDVRK